MFICKRLHGNIIQYFLRHHYKTSVNEAISFVANILIFSAFLISILNSRPNFSQKREKILYFWLFVFIWEIFVNWFAGTCKEKKNAVLISEIFLTEACIFLFKISQIEKYKIGFILFASGVLIIINFFTETIFLSF